jgi:hypothetical protein
MEYHILIVLTYSTSTFRAGVWYRTSNTYYIEALILGMIQIQNRTSLEIYI